MAAFSRLAATLVSFALCLIYLLILPFSAWGMAIVIGVGALVMTLASRPREVVTTRFIPTAVTVVAALSPHNAWQ